MKPLRLCFALVLVCASVAFADQPTHRSHAISMFGDVKYGPDFQHFEYANPNAPKGGTVRMAAQGTYDNLNSFVLKGVSAWGLGMLYDSLTKHAQDEAFSEYGLLSESIETPDDRSWAEFQLRPEARWHDGEPVTPEDVIFTFEILKEKGHPFFKNYLADVQQVEKVTEHRVKFTFGGTDNRELPLIVGQMAILPKHYWEGKDFAATTLEPPLGSGAYKISKVDAGRSITYERVKDYWGQDLAVNKGFNNPDVIRYEYYKDSGVAIEALKGRAFDFRVENISKEWATAYHEHPAFKAGKLVKELVDHENGTGMQGFAFNTRRTKFADPRVREALSYAFDFEWTNNNLFYGQYKRTSSYYSNTELGSSGLPSGLELEILDPYRGRVPEEVFTKTFAPPATDGSGNIRQNLRTAKNMLTEAGWVIQEGKLTNEKTGDVMSIEFLLSSPSFERVVGPYVQNLERLGVESTIRTVDRAQYQNRLQEFDFDATVVVWGQSLSPGNEQRNMWTSEAATTPGSRNFVGIQDPIVDELVIKLINSSDRKTLVATTQALDRVLLWGHYVVPHWHIRSHRLVYWNKFGKPDVSPRYMPSPFTTFPSMWWVDASKAATLGN
ncbi:MAG: ABC transporter substrate-binding protein [Candidatus Latescibacteria bacterium]|jgi:microcin C transport system substrate-binding protein|nr:ABC transporter substrate-binding protein [Candidatus Latescibacterota bacterium]MBT4139244.1 ABC transporter substrate-binding protein [Candidatus Latescibacterota bacterium]MBT5831170.1 ABC transporter substrate-binding protein [Candidatus Latescibacterota bacterium]